MFFELSEYLFILPSPEAYNLWYSVSSVSQFQWLAQLQICIQLRVDRRHPVPILHSESFPRNYYFLDLKCTSSPSTSLKNVLDQLTPQPHSTYLVYRIRIFLCFQCERGMFPIQNSFFSIECFITVGCSCCWFLALWINLFCNRNNFSKNCPSWIVSFKDFYIILRIGHPITGIKLNTGLVAINFQSSSRFFMGYSENKRNRIELWTLFVFWSSA